MLPSIMPTPIESQGVTQLVQSSMMVGLFGNTTQLKDIRLTAIKLREKNFEKCQFGGTAEIQSFHI